MSNHGKKYRNAAQLVIQKTQLSASDGLKKVKELSFAKFDESVDVSVNLGIDPAKGEQAVRGSLVLPHSRGKKTRVIVFAKGDQAEAAKRVGADYVGTDDLVEKISGGWMDFEFAVATPDLMGLVGKLAKQLGPRGLLPNKKLGTVALEVGPVVEELKKGQVFFKNDKQGLVHFSLGRVSFDVDKLYENLVAFMKSLMASKPASSKGRFIKKVTLTSTMGVGIQVNPEDFLKV